MKFEVTTYETMYRTYVVELDTEDAEEARDITAEQIDNGELISPEPELVERCVKAKSEKDDSPWRAF